MTDAPAPKAKKPKADKAAKAPNAGSKLRGWTAGEGGSQVSRTFSYGTPEEVAKAAKRIIGGGQKLNKAVELRLEGSSLTVRLPAANGAVEDDVRKMAKRLSPADPAKKEARAAKAKASEGGEEG